MGKNVHIIIITGIMMVKVILSLMKSCIIPANIIVPSMLYIINLIYPFVDFSLRINLTKDSTNNRFKHM